MALKTNYPFNRIKSERAKDYLERIDCDVYNEDTTLEDLQELQEHLGAYMNYIKYAHGLVVIFDEPARPYVSPGGHY